MPARVLDGKALAERIRADVAERVAARVAAGKSQPGLATVIVGEDPASQTYVAGKRKASAEAGMRSFGHELSVSTSQADVLALLAKLNADPAVHGILVQLPLPAQISSAAVQSVISPDKDVDCLNPTNVGMLSQKGREPRFAPCTPAGILRLIKEAGEPLEGKHAVVLGRSNIVGMPLSLLLTKENATVTLAHSYTRDLSVLCREADVLVAAIGKPEFVRGEWVKPGAIVIDVGINRVEDKTIRRGYRLVGDVAYAEAAEVAAAITPVPGGVGPMTIAMLLENTLRAAELADTPAS
jgi:5,10-methylene-tetrahydrofolate dehydrogenase/methenyl tetrahydrofolate cyclohydrolase